MRHTPRVSVQFIVACALSLILQPCLSAAPGAPSAQATAEAAPAKPVDTERAKSTEVKPGDGPAVEKFGATPKQTQKVEILFGGSLCPVCLIAFQKRLLGTAGVVNAQVEVVKKEKESHSSHPPKRAHVIIEFSGDKLSKADLIEMVKQNDFQFIKAADVPATNL